MIQRYNSPSQAVIFVNEAYYFQNGFSTIVKKYQGGFRTLDPSDYLFEKVDKDLQGDYLTITF